MKIQNFFKMSKVLDVEITKAENWKLPESAEFKKLNFKKSARPEISIIMPVYNNWNYTYNCLSSVLANTADVDYEIIVADDCSDDKTKDIGKIVKNIKVIKNKKNVGFLENCNKAADYAASEYILFLNNDTYVLKDSIFHLLNTIKKDESIGAAGGKIILPDNTLQEAGSIIWKNGSCTGYGRGESPELPEYNFAREVGYCSGAFLLTKKDLFLKLGKFDRLYKPAYYEEVDYCMRLRKEGYKIIYQPRAEIIHYESATIKKDEAVSLQINNAAKFFKKWKKELACHSVFGENLTARFSPADKNKKRILYIDDQIPDPKLGSGYPRTYSILNCLTELGFQITYYPVIASYNNNSMVCSELQQKGIEVMHNTADRSLDFDDFFRERKEYYHIICVSRPHNMQKIINVVKKYNNEIMVIYDAEAIFAKRDIAYLEAMGKKLSENEAEKRIAEEVRLCGKASRIITVSNNEKEIFEKYGVKNLFVVSQEGKIRTTPKKFDQRAGILFLGSVLSDDSENPNFDAIKYFIKEIFPLVRKKIKCDFYIVGTDITGAVKNFNNEEIKVIGSVSDPYEYYNNCKVFVAPTRFSAGIPHKVIEAASYGIALVVTEITADQLRWKDGVDCLVGSSPEEFAEKIVRIYTDPKLWKKIRDNGTKKIKSEYSPELFKESVRKAFNIQTKQDGFF